MHRLNFKFQSFPDTYITEQLMFSTVAKTEWF